MIIDIHTHTFPDKLAALAIPKMQQASHSVAFTAGTVSALKESMAMAGIDKSVVLPVATNPLKVGSINDISIAMAEKELIYFGCIHPETEAPEAELTRIAAAGVKGIKLHPVYQGVDIDDKRFLRILYKAAELGLIVITHAGDDIGFPGVRRCTPRMLRNALRQVGDLTLIAAHMGGWKNWEEARELLCDTSVRLDTAFSLGSITPLETDYYSPEELKLMDTEEFCKTVRLFGSERVFFGSDSPWTDQAQSVADIRALALSETEKDNILGGNAARLLGI